MAGKPEITKLDALIGGNAKRLAKEKQISQTALAEMVDLSVPFVSQLLSGSRAWKTLYIESIASALGVSPIELLGGSVVSLHDKMILATMRSYEAAKEFVELETAKSGKDKGKN